MLLLVLLQRHDLELQLLCFTSMRGATDAENGIIDDQWFAMMILKDDPSVLADCAASR